MSRLSEQQILSRARASSLENVKNLNFWGSDLYDISILRQMPNVEVLSLSVNNITSLKDFAHCPRLRELYLRKNNIRDINEIGCLKNLPKLRVLWLSDNPCADVEHYRMTVLKNLPKLTKLDTIVVEEAEILEATEKGKEIPIPEDTPVYLDFTATADQNPANGANNDNPQTSTAENDNPESSHDNLVNETNKLRAQLGLKPLLLEDPQPNATAAMTTTNIQKKGSGTSSDPRNENILSAVLTLIQELDQTSLLTLRKEIDQQLQDLSKTDNDFKNRSAHMEEKEAITD